MGDNRERMHYLEFSCRNIEITAKPGERIEGSFTIHATDKYAEGKIYSSDTRVRLIVPEFSGQEFVVQYYFEGTTAEVGNIIRGDFAIISNYGEYTVSYNISIQKPQLQCSLGKIKNLFHFTNLAQSNWAEAVELFYSEDFPAIIHKNDRNAYLSYTGLSRYGENEQNIEEFLIEVNKKTPIIYSFDIEGFLLEDVQDSTYRTISITRSGWGYTQLKVRTEGEFLHILAEVLTEENFRNNICDFKFHIDASLLHNGMNSGSIIFYDACNEYIIPVDVFMDDEPEKRNRERKQKQALLNITKLYIDMKFGKKTREQWAEKVEQELEVLKELDEDNVMLQLQQTQLLITKERFNEAKWYLDNLEKSVSKSGADPVAFSYYLYLTTLFNRDEDYIKSVTDEIETAYANNPSKWWIAWFLLYLDESCSRSREYKWQFIEELFKSGCSSPVILCEAVLLLQENPTYLLKLDTFEENVLWHGARHHMLKPDLIEQLQYLAARKKEYSPLLLRILCEVYRTYKSPQTVAAICRQLIIGDKKGPEYFGWYALGVQHSVRVTKLYEYYMMSLELDKYGDIKSHTLEIPRMVLMYFAYQSTLDYELNAFLYAYVIKNSNRYPDLEQSYRIAIERFLVDQIKAGHINENLAYLYQKVLTPRMVVGDMAYSFTPLLFMHRIYVDNPRVKNVVVIHEKVNGESSYPVLNNVCMIPIYGSEYKLFLQDEKGNRFTKSIGFENKQLMEPDKMISYISGYMQGRLSFDIYLCEVDENYITITADNVKRFKNLAESPQVIESFKKEIRTKLLRFYYDNDMIGELDTFLEDIEADEMEAQERAEFIRYMISRGMFDKAYSWLRRFGLYGVNPKSLARLVSKRIITRDYEYEEFLVDVSYYIYKNMKYDENILRYLMLYYEGKTIDLKNLWKSAVELELDTQNIMYRILQQINYTGVNVQEKDEILLAYAGYEEHDAALVKTLLRNTAYEYFVHEAIVYPAIFDRLYQEYSLSGFGDRVCKLAMLKFASENPAYLETIHSQDLDMLVKELLREDRYFPFYARLSDMVPELHYFKNIFFIEYRTLPESKVCIHFAYDDFFDDNFDLRSEEEKAQSANGMEASDTGRYEIQEMREMYDGIYVSVFRLFHGEALQYYITETYADENGIIQEHVTQSDTIFGDVQGEGVQSQDAHNGRFDILNDIMVSITMQDEVTAEQMAEEYLYQDFCARELFRVL